MTANDSFDFPPENKHSIPDESPRPFEKTASRQRRAFQAAAQAADHRGSAPTGDSTSDGIETGNLEKWAADSGQIVSASRFCDLRIVSQSTSEHKVFHDKEHDRALKHTWPGVFGQIPCVVNGHLDRRNATPSEYLLRMALQLEVFGGDLELEGVYISDEPSMIIGQPAGQPSLVISQQWYEKNGTVTTESIHNFLTEEGFRGVPNSYFGFYRPSDGTELTVFIPHD